LNVFDDDDENKLRKTLKQAIDLLQDDYLGGQGSRGYGQVEIKINEEVEKMYPFE
jgi:CRISPR-associated protein Csm3